MGKLMFGQFALAWWALAAVQPPTNLAVNSATNQQVQLSWTAGDPAANQYVVERGVYDPIIGTIFSPLAAISPDINHILATTFADNAATPTTPGFDPFTAYQYRVHAVNTLVVPADVSTASNAVTVGPPPYGYNLVVPAPTNLIAPNFGAYTQMILDGSGDPMLSYVFLNPSFDDSYNDSQLFFVRWDRAHYVWTAPVQAAVTGTAGSFNYNRPLRMVRDASNGALAIVSVNTSSAPVSQVSISDSADNGVTWRNRTVLSDSENYYDVPVIALGGGNVYLAAFHEGDGIRYLTGKLSDDPANWTGMLVPNIGYPNYQDGVDLALDSTGAPAIVYAMSDNSGVYYYQFYRPGSPGSTVFTTSVYPGDYWGIRLGFSGVNPRILFAGAMDNLFFDQNLGVSHMLFLLTSPDGGVTWSNPVNIPADGNSSLNGPVDLSFDSQGRSAVVAQSNGGSGAGEVCGTPKLALSADLQNWSTCGISTTVTSDAFSPGVRYAFNDTLYLVFGIPNYPDPTQPADIAAGVYFWRGPIGFQFPTPQSH